MNENMIQSKKELEQALNEYNNTKQAYEDAIDNQKDYKEVVDNMEIAEEKMFNEAYKFYDTLRTNEENLTESELVENWKLFRQFFETV